MNFLKCKQRAGKAVVKEVPLTKIFAATSAIISTSTHLIQNVHLNCVLQVKESSFRQPVISPTIGLLSQIIELFIYKLF